jgi:molybdopterin converting factor small subunit
MIRLQAFARYRHQLGWDRLDLPLPEPATLGRLLEDPRLAGLPQEALLAVNATFANRETVLKDGDEVGLMPPVSGG